MGGGVALFDFPRIHVRGTHFVNIGTANNDSADPGTEFTVTSDSEAVQAMAQGMSDQEFVAWMSGLDQDGLLRSQWNYYGDMSFRFLDVRVAGVQLSYDRLITDAAQDALIGASVSLTDAVLCDLNPEGFDTTQIFAASLDIHGPGAFADDGVFHSRAPTRSTTRSLNWFRNVSYHGPLGTETSGGAGGASANFQCAIEVLPEDLEPVPRKGEEWQEVLHRFLPTDSSPGAEALGKVLATSRAKGLLFRFSLYLTYPKISDPDLAAAFAKGQKLENPAIGKMVGTIAPWFEGEPTSVTMGRYLKSSTSYSNPYRADHKPYYLSPAVALVDEQTGHISLDASNCLPEDGPEGYKYNMGTVSLGIRAATPPGGDPSQNPGAITVIGDVPNDREFYELHGGMYDLDYGHLSPVQQSWLHDLDHELVLSTAVDGVLLYEPEFMVESDCACSYLDEPPPEVAPADEAVAQDLSTMPHAALRGEVPLYLRHRGRPPAHDVAVRVEQWKVTPTGDPRIYGFYKYPVLLETRSITLSRGQARFPLRPWGGPGLRVFRFVPPGQWPAQMTGDVLANRMFEEFFTSVRVLPYDDYSGVTDEELTFDYVYREVLRYYALIFPAMSTRLDLSDPTLWTTPSAAQYLLTVTDPKLWGNYLYMPRPRDLSRYRRALLQRFCEKVLRDYAQPVPTGIRN